MTLTYKRNNNCKDHGWEQQQVLSLLIEDRWLLEYTQATSASGEKVEQLPVKQNRLESDLPIMKGDYQHLHDNQVHEVNTGRFIRRLLDVTWIVSLIVLSELEPHRRKWHSAPLHVPERHRER